MKLKAVCAMSFVILFHSIEVTESSGKLRMKFVKFRNPGSRSQNGECCDNVQWCLNGCDIFIRFCFTLQSRSSSCSLIDFETSVLGGDTIDFSSPLGNGISNPIVYSFNQWIEPFKTTITVLDDDGQNPLGIGRAADLVSTSDFIISTSPDGDESKAVRHGKVLKGYRSELTIFYQIFCDHGYFKPSCKELCSPKDDSTGHYTCDYDNSKRVCLPNWYGSDCIRYCQPRDDAAGHFLCSIEGRKVCLPNWYAINCTRYCAPSDDVTGHYTCDSSGEKLCLKNWYGENCLRYCNTTHSYTCSPKGEKICTDRYYGVNCSQYCQANERGNYRCLDNGTVICTENYYGPNCSVHCVASSNANGSYSCAQNGSRICNSSWYGIYCGIYCNSTDTSYCLENGTRACLKDWHGPNCDRYCIPDKLMPSRYYCDINGNVVCMLGWYGLNCDNFTGCIDDPTNSSHYYCDKQTGAKVCHFGWAGKNCTFRLRQSATVQPSYSISVPTFASMFTEFAPSTERSVATIISLPSLSLQEYASSYKSQIAVVVDRSQQKIGSLSLTSCTSALSCKPFTNSETVYDSFVALNKHTIKSSLAGSKAMISKTPQIEVTRKAGATEFYRNSSLLASPLHIPATPTVANVSGRMVSSFLGGKNNKASFGYSEVMTEFQGDTPTMMPTLSKAESKTTLLPKHTLVSSKNTWVVPSAFSEREETIQPRGKSESRQDFSTVNGRKEMGEESLRASRTLMLSFEETVAIQHTGSSIDPTTYATVERRHVSPMQNSSRNQGRMDKTQSETRKLLLFIGIPVIVSLLVMSLVAAKLCNGSRGRVSRSKVKAIKIDPASSTLEKKRFLRSRRVEEESVSILPLIWLQLNKQHESKQNFDDLINFY